MPHYDFTCATCSTTEDHYVPYAEYDARRAMGFPCPCGGHQQFAPNFHAIFTDRPGLYPMYSPAADQTFSSKQDYNRYKQEHELEYTGKGWL